MSYIHRDGTTGSSPGFSLTTVTQYAWGVVNFIGHFLSSMWYGNRDPPSNVRRLQQPKANLSMGKGG